jgi:hypothetical protein
VRSSNLGSGRLSIEYTSSVLRRIAWFLVFQSLALATAVLHSEATTWMVAYDPLQTVDRIGSIVTLTAEGDTILVGPGTYYEHIRLPVWTLTLKSTEGNASTILDGSLPIPGREGSILYSLGPEVGPLNLSGFTLRRGTGAAIPYSLNTGGGAIALEEDSSVRSVSIVDCIFEENTSNREWSGDGGAIWLSNLDAIVVGCLFRNNSAQISGAHAYLYGGHYTFTRCRFEIGGSTCFQGKAIYADDVTDLKLHECTVLGGPDDLLDSGAIYTNGNWLELVGNSFLDVSARSATVVLAVSGFTASTHRVAILRENLFIGISDAGPGRGPGLYMPVGRIEIEGNTFVDTPIETGLATGDPLRIAGNILKNSPLTLDYGPGGIIECNDIWPDSASTTVGCCGIEVGENISADPLFCDWRSGDFRLAELSPCAAGQAPAGCGQIGALGVGCTETPVKRVTWGRLKALYR